MTNYLFHLITIGSIHKRMTGIVHATTYYTRLLLNGQRHFVPCNWKKYTDCKYVNTHCGPCPVLIHRMCSYYNGRAAVHWIVKNYSASNVLNSSWKYSTAHLDGAWKETSLNTMVMMMVLFHPIIDILFELWLFGTHRLFDSNILRQKVYLSITNTKRIIIG